jgi:hypothetical protein
MADLRAHVSILINLHHYVLICTDYFPTIFLRRLFLVVIFIVLG